MQSGSFWKCIAVKFWKASVFADLFQDAAKAYSALHLAALRKAIEAKEESQLKEAYFLEGYGQHFLTDLFSAGHIRVPRRAMHSKWPLFAQSGIFEKVYPADQCALLQHDEDCANGLWVTNALNQSWAAYGDKQLLDGRSAKHLQFVSEASQLGVDEIYQAYQQKKMVHTTDFAALKKVCQCFHCHNVRLNI